MRFLFAACAILGAAIAFNSARAAEIKVVGSPGFREAYTELVPGFEKMTGNKVTTNWGGVNEVAKRVADGEMSDIVILPIAQIDDLIAHGRLLAPSRVIVAKSGVGVAIRTGASGAHMVELIKKWGIADQLKGKIVVSPPDTPVGVVVARGDAEIGFQQVSELINAKGVDYLGPLPMDIQEITVFAAAVQKTSRSPDGAQALIKFLSAPEATPVIKKAGMDPG